MCPQPDDRSTSVVEIVPETGDTAANPGIADPTDDIALTVGRNLRRLRMKRGYSLERLARLSGVSRGMLGQIELGRSAPTISLLWKVATALDVTFATLTASGTGGGTQLLPRAKSKILASSEGRFTSRALFPFDNERRVEFYELRIAPGHEEMADAHAPGTMENLAVSRGSLELFDGEERHLLQEGDSILFEAGLPHAYRNPGQEEAVVYLVMTYVAPIG